MTETEREVMLAHLGALCSIGNRIATALEKLVLHTGLQGQALDELVGKFPKTKRKRRPKRKRKPRGLAASLVSLVLLVGCGGVASRTESFEGGPVPLAEGGAVRVEQRDSGVDGDAIECTPDAERSTGVLCMHPKRRRDADGGVSQR